MRDADPLILTAAFDPRSARMLQALRDAHFPAGLNIVPAHLTLFHHLPGANLPTILAALRADPLTAPPFRTGGLKSLGRGVAIEIVCPPLLALRQRLAAVWADDLTAQDRQGFRAHVTVQNKVTAAEARATLEQLTVGFGGESGTLEGLDLWWYRGGPWEPAGSVRWPLEG